MFFRITGQKIGNKGFTLVELLVALFISGVIASAVFSAYIVQKKSYETQDVVIEMQQSVRFALLFISKEIRMAGYDRDIGTNNSTCNIGATGSPTQPGILASTANQLDLSADLNFDGDCGDPGENVSYYLYTTGGVQKFGRRDNNNLPVQPMAENIEAIEFRYLDSSGADVTVPAQVRAVEVSILARTSRGDPEFTNSTPYCPGSHPIFDAVSGKCKSPSGASVTAWGPYNDNLRRRLLVTTIQCRNMGL